jgi:hypothetical protein
MRRTILKFACLVIAGCACAGCFPWRFNASPGASGTVLDSRTHSPVDGAHVAISLSRFPPSSADDALAAERQPKVTTDKDGRFSVPSDRRWGIYIWPVDALPEFGLLVVDSDGYDVAEIPVWSRSVTNVGAIYLKPAKPGSRPHAPSAVDKRPETPPQGSDPDTGATVPK